MKRLLLFFLLASCAPRSPESAPAVVTPPPKAAPVPPVTTYAYEGAVHQDGPLTYRETPPVGGPHHGVWQNCGVYTRPVPSERAVHSMEHGAVWITYRPDLPLADVVILTELVKGRASVLLSPFPDLPAPVILSAWNRQQRFSGVDEPRVREFMDRFEQGANAPERGGPCTGGSSAVR